MAYRVSTLKKRNKAAVEALLGERAVFVLVGGLEELKELSQLGSHPNICVQLSPSFHQYAKRLYSKYVYEKDAKALEEIQEFLRLLCRYRVSPDASVRNKSMLYNLIAVSRLKLRPQEGLMRMLVRED